MGACAALLWFVDMQCPNCGYDNLRTNKFCGQCGVRLGRVCPACGFINPAEHRFCGECGSRFDTETTAAATVTPAGTGLTFTRTPMGNEKALVSELSGPDLEGERRVATVLLADVSGSTDLLQHLGSEGWVEIMNRVLQILESEVYRFGGRVDQFRGDGLVAFFGAASAHEDDPERAVLAGLAMHRALEPYAADLNERQGVELKFRVGINTGEMIVTSVGDSRQYREDTAMGEAVAVAARMESAAEPGTVLVSETTFRLVESHFEWKHLGMIHAKGISEPIAVYRPVAPRSDADRLHRLEAYGLSIPLIGRDAEFHVLKGCVEDLQTGRGAIVLVSGDEGIGKSFLVSEVRQHFARHGALLAEAVDRDSVPPTTLTWLRGRCRSYDQAWPYSVWLSLLRNWLGIHRGEPSEQTRQRLHAQAELLWGDRLAEYYPFLATVLSLPLEPEYDDRIKHLDAEGWHRQFSWTIRAWVAAMAARAPLVISFADVHWADPTSLDLLKYCLPLCDHEALLWLIVFRPERTSPVWEFRHYVETEYPHRVVSLTLPPLDESQSHEFLSQLIGEDALAQETRELVVRKAEGNPYYLGELVRSLIAQGVLTRREDSGKWELVRPVTTLDLPDSLQTLLLARIDRLTVAERLVLQLASVIGSVFWSDVLQALVDDVSPATAHSLGSETLKRHLTALQRAQLVQERGRVPELGMEYLFTSNLVRDAAYESLLSAQRKRYHSRVAEHMEEAVPQETLFHYYGLLAYHYQQAGLPQKELRYTLLAADQAKEVYANMEALGRYTRALLLLSLLEAGQRDEESLRELRRQGFQVLDARRHVHRFVGNAEEARDDARALLAIAHQLPEEPRWMIDALLRQPGVQNWRTWEEFEAGRMMAEEALRLAREVGDRRREMQSLGAIASQHLWVNDPTAWDLAEQALRLARELGERQYEVSMLIGMGRVYEWSDQPERGATYLEEALPLCQELGDKRAEIELLKLIGLRHERAGDYWRLLKDYQERRLQLSREIGDRPAEAEVLMQFGQIIALRLGDYDTGLPLLEECQEIWDGLPSELFPTLRIAQVHLERDQVDQATSVLEHAGRIMRTQAVPELGHAGYLLITSMHHAARATREDGNRLPELNAAMEAANRTRQLAVDAPLTRQFEMAALCELSKIYLALAEATSEEADRQFYLEQSLESSRSALDVFEHFGFVQIIECSSEEVQYRHALALAANGRHQESLHVLAQAHQEMMRKRALIPADSVYHKTFIENIPLHREIHVTFTEQALQRRTAIDE